ncbi:ABC transporter G family member 27 isoform X1 [Drosophila pseudoobscura]|uniref:ABC transporter G family member 27 isoform X1 n=1 Tax=Drosophila pseudoobscura pseudoobscura TaxID=46245 RepID=A0A6I8UK61_DROPS|nr:ABC transporter G family member 27 isoform X1 [Drosophila pseudoobscura]
MIISKDLFIFGEQIFATIIPEGGAAAVATQQQQEQQQNLQQQQQQKQQQQQQQHLQHQQQQPAIITTTTTGVAAATAATSLVINSTASPAAAAAAATAAGAAEQVVEESLKAATATATEAAATPADKQETVAVAPLSLPLPLALPLTLSRSLTIRKTGKISKIPKEPEELKAKKKAKCEAATATAATPTPPAAAAATSATNYEKMPMNLMIVESVETVDMGSSDNDNETTEQVPLVSASRRNLAKIVADCRLQIEIEPTTTAAPPAATSTTSKVATDLAAATAKDIAEKTTSSSSSSSASTSSSSSTSSEFTHTSQTTIPSTDNLTSSNGLANMGKSILVDAKSGTPASLAYPFLSGPTPIAPTAGAPQQQPPHQPATPPTLQLTFQNLNVLHNERKILSDVSGFVSPCEVLAVMGPSGSGKTTLLDCLSGQRHIDSGSVFLNREPLSKKWRRRIGYVLQEEIFFPQLTLRETVVYTALLRLPESMPRAEKMRQVDHILEALELGCCQQTRFGDYLNRGLSGGEKKRANIACELLTNPLLMLLDEPTSGLDSHSAISLMKVLKRYAQLEQKTIVISVHQPSSQMFHMFDKLLLLHQGRTAYFGDVHNIYRHFEDIGVTIKPHYNPADFVLEQLKSHPDIREKLFVAAKESHGNYLNRNCITSSHHPCGESKVKKQTDSILIDDIINNYYNQHHHSTHHHLHQPHHHHHHHHHQYENLHHTSSGCQVEEDEEAAQHLVWCGADSQSNFSSCASSDCHSYSAGSGGPSHTGDEDWLSYPTSFHTQFCVLSSRNFKEAKPRMLSKLNWFQTIGLALMAGAIWFQLPRTEEFLHDLQGWMFFSQTYWMLFALFGALNSFPSEREVISKERRSGAYRLSAYYLAKMCAELPLVVTLPTVYLMISYPMLGCTSLKLFFLMLIFLLINTIVAQSVGFFIGACCMDMNVSITLSALYTLATQLFGGYLSSRIPEGLSWIRYTSMIHYAYQNMQILEFREGPAVRCGSPSSYEICKQQTTEFIPYEEILKAQNSTSPLWLNTLILMMFFLVFRCLGYAVLRYLRCPKKT